MKSRDQELHDETLRLMDQTRREIQQLLHTADRYSRSAEQIAADMARKNKEKSEDAPSN